MNFLHNPLHVYNKECTLNECEGEPPVEIRRPQRLVTAIGTLPAIRKLSNLTAYFICARDVTENFVFDNIRKFIFGNLIFV